LDDKNPRTITLRDTVLSPIGSATTDPTVDVTGAAVSTTGSIVAYSPVTLFASDTTTYSISNTFMVYTKYAGTDTITSTVGGFASGVQSIAGTTGMTISYTSTGSTTTGVFYTYNPAADGRTWASSGLGLTASSDSTNGLCLQVASGGGGNAYGFWTSPDYYFSLTKNYVYRIRLNIAAKSGTNIAMGTTPFWDVYIDNYNDLGTGDGKYFTDFYNLDHNGGVNGALGGPNSIAAGKTQFDIWFNPPQINSSTWNNGGVFTDDTNNATAYSGEFDSTTTHPGFRVTFRVLDYTNGAKVATNDYGTLCFRSISLAAVPISSLSATSTLWSATPNNTGSFVVNTLWGYTAVGAPDNTKPTLLTTDGAGTTLAPNMGSTLQLTFNGVLYDFSGQNAWDTEVIGVYPGWYNAANALVDLDAAYTTTESEVTQVWPIKWVSSELLKGTITVAAPTALAQNYPIDGMQFSWDNPTYEIFQNSMALYGSYKNPLGMPLFGTDTDYVTFFYTHSKSTYTSAALTKSSANAQRLRLKFGALLSTTINSGNRFFNDNSGVLVKGFKIQLVALPLNLQ
jgi:hypothetical protein